MYGGTPFAVLNIQGQDVPRRAGVWNAMKRYIWMYVCICVYVYVYRYINLCLYVFVCIDMYIDICGRRTVKIVMKPISIPQGAQI
jgi:hypothetical protein